MANGRPRDPRAFEPVGEHGSPSALPSNPNSRRGRKGSPLKQGQDPMDALYVGIDVSTERLDVDVCQAMQQLFNAPRTDKGIESLIASLLELKPTLVAVEAKGGFERVVAAGLA